MKLKEFNELQQKDEFKDVEEITAIGIDQGYANMGYCVISLNLKKNHYKILESGTKTTPSEFEMGQRLVSLHSFLKGILNKHPEISLIGCERLFHNKPMGTANFFQQRNKSASIMKTNMVTGVIYLLSGEFNLKINDFPPTTVKKQVAGSGKANKEDVEKAIYEIAVKQGIEIGTDHEADAIAIGVTTINEYIETLLNKDKVKVKRKKSKKDFIDINSKTHELTILYKKRCVIKKVEEDINRDLFLKKYSKEHLIKSKRHKIKMKE